MTNLELVLNMLAETATTEISQKREPKNLDENKKVAREGGSVAGNARKDIEEKYKLRLRDYEINNLERQLIFLKEERRKYLAVKRRKSKKR